MVATLSGGAEDGTRTRDLLITNQLLYQLSYFGLNANRGNMPLRRRKLNRKPAISFRRNSSVG